MPKPTIQNLKDLFAKETGLNADAKPADFSAFLYIRNHELLRQSLRQIDLIDRHPQPISPKQLVNVLSRLLISDTLLYQLQAWSADQSSVT